MGQRAALTGPLEMRMDVITRRADGYKYVPSSMLQHEDGRLTFWNQRQRQGPRKHCGSLVTVSA